MHLNPVRRWLLMPAFAFHFSWKFIRCVYAELLHRGA